MEETKPLFVTDASVIVKWAVYEEEDRSQALMIRDDLLRGALNVIVPSFCFSELCNAIYLRSPRTALDFISYLLTSEITQYSLSLTLTNLAFQLMDQYRGISFYDASYHALAINYKGTFLTADEKYYKKTHKEGHIMLLKDYGKKR